jgi:mediator of RNA polymerase II transcription subunit 31
MPALVHADLAQNKYLEDPAFLSYLKYLGYWRKPEYAQYIQ